MSNKFDVIEDVERLRRAVAQHNTKIETGDDEEAPLRDMSADDDLGPDANPDAAPEGEAVPEEEPAATPATTYVEAVKGRVADELELPTEQEAAVKMVADLRKRAISALDALKAALSKAEMDAAGEDVRPAAETAWTICTAVDELYDALKAAEVVGDSTGEPEAKPAAKPAEEPAAKPELGRGEEIQ